MKKYILFLFLFTLLGRINAQEADTIQRRTIKVQKKGQLAKVQFDNVYYRLIGIDQYGNVLDTAVVEFQMAVNVNGIFYSEKATGPQLTDKMQQLLSRCNGPTKLFFSDIKARDKSGTIVDEPKFQYMFGYSSEKYQD